MATYDDWYSQLWIPQTRRTRTEQHRARLHSALEVMTCKPTTKSRESRATPGPMYCFTSATWHSERGESTYGISVDFVIELEEDTEAMVCKDGVRRFGEGVVV